MGEGPARRAGEQCCRQFSGADGRAVAARLRRRDRHRAQRHHQHDAWPADAAGCRPSIKGVVLNIATTYAETGSAYVVPSAVAKAGVLALTRSLAVEWGGRGIRFVAIAPGAIRTEGAFSRLLPAPDLEKALLDHNPLHRLGTLEEICQSGRVPHQRSGRLHQWRNGLHGRRRNAGRRQQLQPAWAPGARRAWEMMKPKKEVKRSFERCEDGHSPLAPGQSAEACRLPHQQQTPPTRLTKCNKTVAGCRQLRCVQGF